MQSGIYKIWPHKKDLSLIPTFGATTDGLPDNFSIYSGQTIPDQDALDERFVPATRPLPMGCTAETTTFIASLEDGILYPPDDFYFATPPGTDGTGRQLRDALATACNRGFKLPDGTIGNKRGAYFNCYGSGAIDDFDAARIGIWINQAEKRGVSIGSYWYWGVPSQQVLRTPSFNTSQATLHNYVATGWQTVAGVQYLEIIPWVGMATGDKGVFLMSRPIYNALMEQPWTGAFTLAEVDGQTPVSVGTIAYYDHIVYVLNQFIRNLFNI